MTTTGSSGPPVRGLLPPEECDDADIAAAVAIILFDEGGPRVLLIKRRESPDDPWSGHVAFPGGRAEASDDSPMTTLQREVKEEVGLDLGDAGEVLGCLPPQAPANRPGMAVLPFVVHLAGPPRLKPNYEVEATFSAPLRELSKARIEVDVEVRGETLHVPAFDVEGRIVWGFTYRVLEELLARLTLTG